MQKRRVFAKRITYECWKVCIIPWIGGYEQVPTGPWLPSPQSLAPKSPVLGSTVYAKPWKTDWQVHLMLATHWSNCKQLHLCLMLHKTRWFWLLLAMMPLITIKPVSRYHPTLLWTQTSHLLCFCAGVAAAAGEVAMHTKHLAIYGGEGRRLFHSFSCRLFWCMEAFCSVNSYSTADDTTTHSDIPCKMARKNWSSATTFCMFMDKRCKNDVKILDPAGWWQWFSLLPSVIVLYFVAALC